MTALLWWLGLLVVIAFLHGIWIIAASFFLLREINKRDGLLKEMNFHFSEMSKALGGRSFLELPKETETKVVVNDQWDDEKPGTD